MITPIIIIICTSVILYHIYKIKNNLDAQFKDLRYNQNLNNIDSDSNLKSIEHGYSNSWDRYYEQFKK